MLAALISLLENSSGPQPPKPKPRVFVDRGGGGGAGYPAFQIADFIAASQSFPERVGEDALARAVRRAEHIHRELAHRNDLRRASSVAMSQGLLLGAELQRRVQEAEIAVAADTAKRAASTRFWNPAPHVVAAPPASAEQQPDIVPTLVAGGLLLGLVVAIRRAVR